MKTDVNKGTQTTCICGLKLDSNLDMFQSEWSNQISM